MLAIHSTRDSYHLKISSKAENIILVINVDIYVGNYVAIASSYIKP